MIFIVYSLTAVGFLIGIDEKIFKGGALKHAFCALIWPYFLGAYLSHRLCKENM